MQLKLAPKCSVRALPTSTDAWSSKGGLAMAMAGICNLLNITLRLHITGSDIVTHNFDPHRVSFSTLPSLYWRLGWILAGTDRS